MYVCLLQVCGFFSLVFFLIVYIDVILFFLCFVFLHCFFCFVFVLVVRCVCLCLLFFLLCFIWFVCLYVFVFVCMCISFSLSISLSLSLSLVPLILLHNILTFFGKYPLFFHFIHSYKKENNTYGRNSCFFFLIFVHKSF